MKRFLIILTHFSNFDRIKNLLYFSERKNDVDKNSLKDELKAIQEDEALQIYFLDLFSSGKIYPNDPNSSVAYVLGITNDLPTSYPIGLDVVHGANNPPDCDIDWPQGDRERMIDYTVDKYSPEFVSHITTFSMIKARTAVRDATRVLGYDYALGDVISNSLPPLLYGVDTPLWACLEENQRYAEGYAAAEEFRRLYASNPEVTEVVDTALALEGQIRQAGVHAAGILIGDRPISELAPLECRVDGSVFTQWDKCGVEEIGLLKMDFLGLINLDIIKDTCDAVGITTDNIPLDDDATFDLLRSGDVVGLFQIEGAQMRSLIRQMRPDSIKDIAALLALYRPGPIAQNWHIDYIERKNRIQAVSYFHPDAEPILKDTYGIPCFQEQVMGLARQFAGYSMVDADNLRRIIGKKKPDEMRAERARFVAGCVDAGYGEEFGGKLFEMLEGFAAYGFSKLHSYPYAVVTIWTAYLKTYYPVEYMSALCSYTTNNLEKCAVYIHEAKRMGIPVVTPDVNESSINFTARDGKIVVGLSAIKGIGKSVAEGIVEEQKNGDFLSVMDFIKRCNPSIRTVIALAKAGALDAWGTRLGLIATADDMLKHHRKHKNKGESLFDAEDYVKWDIPTQEYSDAERLALEKEVLGLYISGHPLDAYQSSRTDINTVDLKEVDLGGYKLLVMITDVKITKTKKGDQMAILTVEDDISSVEVVVFPKSFAKLKEALFVGDIGQLTVRSDINKRSGDKNYIFSSFSKLSKLSQRLKGDLLDFYLPRGFVQNGEYMSRLKSIFLANKGDSLISLFAGQQTRVKLTEDFRVDHSPELMDEVKQLFIDFKENA